MPSPAPPSRYSRQERFAPIGEAGQQRLAAARVLVCGCGALGSLIAERLARSGVGALRLVDRDWVELSNLQRQTLFTEEDARQARPKAVAAADALTQINGSLELEPIVEDVGFHNLAALAEGCDLILDGTDNFETRFLINDYCIQASVPWVHGGCLGASGQVMTIVPGVTACFRCLLPDLPPRDAIESCDTAGVLGPAVGLVACLQAAEALKLLSGNQPQICPGLMVLDTWNTEFRIVNLKPRSDCQTCGQRKFPFLSGEIRSEATVLCGKNAVQIQSPHGQVATLESLVDKLRLVGEVSHNPFFVRVQLPEYQLTIFRGGRTVVEGTVSVAEAKSLVARILGS